MTTPSDEDMKKVMDAITDLEAAPSSFFIRPERQHSRTIKAFMQCLSAAKAGKTFIFWHRDFVTVDHKTWRELQQRLHPPTIIVDEGSTITDEQLNAFDEAYKKYKKS